MNSSSYKKRFKIRFAVWWRRLVPLMAFVYLFDIATRAMTSTPMKAATINAYIAIPIVTLLLAVILAVISPAFRPIIFIFKKITANEYGLLFTLITGAGITIYVLGWWSLAILFFILWVTHDSSGSSSHVETQEDEGVRKARAGLLNEEGRKVNDPNR